MQEAFVAALLAIARRSGNQVVEEDECVEDLGDGWLSVHSLSDDTDLNKLVLWVEIKKQIEILREGMDDEKRKVPAYLAEVDDFAECVKPMK